MYSHTIGMVPNIGRWYTIIRSGIVWEFQNRWFSEKKTKPFGGTIINLIRNGTTVVALYSAHVYRSIRDYCDF